MEQISYHRPREKLQVRGEHSLLDTELLQIIIGSGSRKVSGARIAKNVASLLQQKNPPTYQELLRIPGLGDAKTCQIIAALELGRRVKKREISDVTSVKEFKVIETSSIRRVAYNTYDGNGALLQKRSEPARDVQAAFLAIRKIFANALYDSAASLTIGIGSRNQRIDILEEETLNIVKKMFETADLLQIQLHSVWLINNANQQSFRRKAFQ